ncbi:hypothetical protein NDU88_001828 [Pleurodeles waltl]|uniref:Uncharacterized protein n=1 Tax=Pleurodeles waltl TaxID=8319 RepID=A0AAV7NBY6_PLEWA|nr:hypothetical protein NDU88_001828 [Pleurodeles waltl]
MHTIPRFDDEDVGPKQSVLRGEKEDAGPKQIVPQGKEEDSGSKQSMPGGEEDEEMERNRSKSRVGDEMHMPGKAEESRKGREQWKILTPAMSQEVHSLLMKVHLFLN